MIKIKNILHCLFCGEPFEYSEENVDVVCSSCVQMLSRADQEDLKRAYDKAIIDEQYVTKARAILLFLNKEGDTENVKQNNPRGIDIAKRTYRRRRTRVNGAEKTTISNFKKYKKTPIRKNNISK